MSSAYFLYTPVDNSGEPPSADAKLTKHPYYGQVWERLYRYPEGTAAAFSAFIKATDDEENAVLVWSS